MSNNYSLKLNYINAKGSVGKYYFDLGKLNLFFPCSRNNQNQMIRELMKATQRCNKFPELKNANGGIESFICINPLRIPSYLRNKNCKQVAKWVKGLYGASEFNVNDINNICGIQETQPFGSLNVSQKIALFVEIVKNTSNVVLIFLGDYKIKKQEAKEIIKAIGKAVEEEKISLSLFTEFWPKDIDVEEIPQKFFGGF